MTNLHLLSEFRREVTSRQCSGFILPITDEYQGEYSADYAHRVTWLTGFDGSAGMLIVSKERALLLTDGRYTLQAAAETDDALYEVRNSADIRLYEAIIELSHETDTIIGYDPWLHTHQQITALTQALPEHISLRPCAPNPLDAIWKDQPARPVAPVIAHAEQHHGRNAKAKIDNIISGLNADALLLTLPDDICWLLNIRGADIPYNPLPLCYAVLDTSGHVHLLINPAKLAEIALPDFVHCVDEQHIDAFIASLKYDTIQLDPASCPHWFVMQCEAAGITINQASNPVLSAKAIKNPTEITGIKRAHAIDGVAVSQFLQWCEKLPTDDTITELDAIEKLESFRREHPDYLGPSFATIAGAGPHGAIVHYRASERTNREWKSGEALLVDSGGQYPYGTTDITRTIMRGSPQREFVQSFTLVLKGHIALACAIFPEGTTGHQLDVLARQFLWQAGLDYQHGTGHGVGHYLCVHEGPQSISSRPNGVALQPGMILSNEPGYYETGAYGIRIESLVLVVEKFTRSGKRYFGFDTLSLAPIDASLVDATLLSTAEKDWLADYNTRCEANIASNARQ